MSKEDHSKKQKEPPVISNRSYNPDLPPCLGDCTKCILDGNCQRPHVEPKKIVQTEEELKKIIAEELSRQ
jgi:hypothetical protein